jgi:hypothetical protein
VYGLRSLVIDVGKRVQLMCFIHKTKHVSVIYQVAAADIQWVMFVGKIREICGGTNSYSAGRVALCYFSPHSIQ